MLVAERRSISRIVFVRHPSTSIHRVRCRMYSTKHRKSSKRSSRDSDFTNQHQPSLSVTPIVPQQRVTPLPAPPSLRWKPFLEEKATCEESVAAVTRLLDGTDDGISFWKPARSAKSNSGNETTCAVLAWADARPARTCRAPEVQCRRWQPLPVSTRSYHTPAHEHRQICI